MFPRESDEVRKTLPYEGEIPNQTTCAEFWVHQKESHFEPEDVTEYSWRRHSPETVLSFLEAIANGLEPRWIISRTNGQFTGSIRNKSIF